MGGGGGMGGMPGGGGGMGGMPGLFLYICMNRNINIDMYVFTDIDAYMYM
jgi:hypothetical protein